MKSKITILIVFSIVILGYSQEVKFDNLAPISKTKILYDRVFKIATITRLRTAEITTEYYLQAYSEIQRADFLNRFPNLQTLKANGKLGIALNQVPLSILMADFETLNKSSIENGDIKLTSDGRIEVMKNENTVLQQHSITLTAPLLTKVKNKNVTFLLSNDMIFNTTDKAIQSIYLSSNSEDNWKKVIINEPITINFENNGKQTVNCKIRFTTGETYEQSFQLEIESQDGNVSDKKSQSTQETNATTNITATIPFQGYDETAAYLGQGEYDVFLDTTNGILDKPIFLIDGFDPSDSRNIASIYQLLNYNSGDNLADSLRAQGFDVIILNFPTYTRPNTTTVVDGGADYIQRNAMILVALINQINAQKVGTQKNVVIGPSMGGLIARYALRYMEMNNLTHDTRLYISFDAPHLGANVPISFQHQINYLAYGPLGFTELQDYVDGYLKSPSSRQMLIDHFEGHLQNNSQFEFNSSILLPTGKPSFRDVFQNELNSMGFPITTRNISISNGTSNGARIGTPGMTLMGHTFNTSSTERAIIDLKFTPIANQTLQVSRFRGQYSLFGNWLTIYDSQASSKSPTFTDGLDSAPGGRYDMYSLESAFGTSALLTEFFDNLLTQYFCFIPTISSMAITNTTNLYSPVIATSNTPFVAYSIPTVNENHVTLTQTNATFAINEILNGALSISDTTTKDIWVKNPTTNTIDIYSTRPYTNTTIRVTDILGKVFYDEKNKTISNETSLDISGFSKGVYLLNIKGEEINFTKKIVKK